MSTDLEQRIAELATAWERDAPTISLAEIRERPRSIGASPDVRADAASGDAVVVALDVPGRRPNRTRRSLAVAAAVVVVAVGAGVLALRSPDDVEPSSPVTTVPEPDAAAPGIDAPSPAQPAADTTMVDATVVGSSVPAPSVPATLPADEVAAKLAEIEAEQHEALRGFTSIGFTVTRTEILPDGLPPEAYTSSRPVMRAVVRNDGSTAVVASDGGFSYYDATTGTASNAHTGPDGAALFQVWSGQNSAHMAFGIPTGLGASVVVPAGSLSMGVVGIEQDVVGGRPSWRVDQVQLLPSMSGGPDEEFRTSTWIDRGTGIVVRTRSTSWARFVSGLTYPVTAEATVSEIELGAPMPGDFDAPVPVGATVERFGDPFQFEAITYEAAAVELGPGTVVPTLAADQVVVERIVMGEGLENTGISLVARWFDGFAATELRVMRFPAMMEMTDSCTSCTEPLLEQVRSAPITDDGITVAADGFSVSITGDPERIRSIVDSLVTVG